MVRRWLQRFRQDGCDGLMEGDHSGQLPDITLAIELFLANCLSKSPRNFKVSRPTWSTIHLANIVQQIFKVRVSNECIRQHLLFNRPFQILQTVLIRLSWHGKPPKSRFAITLTRACWE